MRKRLAAALASPCRLTGCAASAVAPRAGRVRLALLREVRAAIAVACTAIACAAHGAGLADEPLCGDEGVWIQVLGSGSGTLDGRAAASYLAWLDGRARLLVDPGPGSSVRFGEARADFADLDAIVLSNVDVRRTSDLPAFIAGNRDRSRQLALLGPAGANGYPATSELVQRLLGANGAYAGIADLPARDEPGAQAGAASGAPAAFAAEARHRLDVENIPAVGSRRWARFGSPHLRLAAIPVHHGDAPSLAWRVDIGGKKAVFTGSFSNRKDAVWRFARDADILVIHHAIPENARGAARERHVTPSQIGRIARRANVRMVLLGHRAPRTQGLESISRAALEEHYGGPLLFANELECWGL